MTFPDIKQRKPDCDISVNAQVTAANFKAKKYSIKKWQKLSLETLGSVSGWENMKPKKTWLYFYTISSHQRKTLWNLKRTFIFQSTHRFLKQRCNPVLNFIGCFTDFQKGSNSKLISTEHFATSLLASSLLYSTWFSTWMRKSPLLPETRETCPLKSHGVRVCVYGTVQCHAEILEAALDNLAGLWEAL